jgi:hypothetical protein
MVGIYAKIKNGLNYIKDKAMKNVLPLIGTIGDIASNPTVQQFASMAAGGLNMLAPGFGTVVSKALPYISNLGNMAKSAHSDYMNNETEYGNNLGVVDIIGNVIGGDYGSVSGKPSRKVVSKGIGLAKNFNDLNPRIKLNTSVKALMPPGPVIEELDE